jgi:hypothetical protein
MKWIYAILATVLAILLAALAFAYSGLYDVAATTPHSGPVSWFMHTT